MNAPKTIALLQKSRAVLSRASAILLSGFAVRVVLGAILLSASLFGVAQAAPIYPDNNGFETPNLNGGNYVIAPSGGGWTFTGNSGIASNATGEAVGAPKGQQSDTAISLAGQAGFVQPGGSFTENVTLPAGVYNVSFIWEAWSVNGACPLSVSLGGHVLFSGTTYDTTSFDPVASSSVILPAGTYALTFTATSSSGYQATFIDTVAINSVSNPGTTTTFYTYDALDRLTQVKYADGTTLAYSYDAAGNRLARSVSNVGIPPWITSANNALFTVGQAGSFKVTATGTPTPTFTATGLPSWAVLKSSTGVISGTPPDTSGSPISVTVTASNGSSPDATQTLTLNVQATKAAQTITFDPLPETYSFAPPFPLAATANSSLPVSYSLVSGPATVSGNIVTLTGQPGTVTIKAYQHGNSNYAAATTVTQSFKVVVYQYIYFPTIATQPTTASSITLQASVNSSLPVSYASVSGPATLSGNVLTLTGQPGTVVIKAYQHGDAYNLPATTVTESFKVGLPVTFSQWATDNTLSTGGAATPENDGVANLFKYLFNINPTRPMTTADRAALPAFALSSTGTLDYLTLTYRQYALSTGLTVEVQTSPDLKAWQSVTPEFAQPIGVDAVTGDPLQEVAVNVTGLSTAFIRLKVTGTISGQPVSVVTIPEGFMSYNFAATTTAGSTSYLSLPLTDDPIYANVVSAVTANTITVADSKHPWTTGALATPDAPYFVKFLSGQESGRITLITSNTSNALTLDTSDNSSQTLDLTTVGFSVNVGDAFEVLPGDTLASAFGVNTTAEPLTFNGAASYASADLVEIYNPAMVAWQNYYFDTGSSCWKLNGSTFNANNTIVYPYAALKIVRRANEGSLSFTPSGRVAEVANLIKTTGSNVLIYGSTGYATSTTLSELKFGTNWTENAHTTTADNLSIWNPASGQFNTYFELSDGTWRVSGDATTDQSNVVLTPGGVISILKRGAVSGPASFLKPTLPYPSN